MFELHDYEGVFLGAAAEWRWPVQDGVGRLVNLLVLDRHRWRYEVMVQDQAPVRVQWRDKGGNFQSVAGRLTQAPGAEMRAWQGSDPAWPTWLVEQVLIEVTGSGS
jgi:hypothetical protein